MLTDTFSRVWAWLVAHPEFTALVVIPLVGAALNALDGVVAKRFPRLAGVVAALLPHVANALNAAKGEGPKTSLPPPPNEEPKK